MLDTVGGAHDKDKAELGLHNSPSSRAKRYAKLGTCPALAGRRETVTAR
jgi:hypothetical protein